MTCIVLPCSAWDGLRVQLTAWAEPTLAVLGILTLVGAAWSWSESWRTVNLQVARRARRVMRILDDWAAYPTSIAGTDSSPLLKTMAWRDRMVAGENEVQELLEQMLDLVGGAGPWVRRATRSAYRSFLLGSDVINSGTQEVDKAAAYFATVRTQIARIVPKDLV